MHPVFVCTVCILSNITMKQIWSSHNLATVFTLSRVIIAFCMYLSAIPFRHKWLDLDSFVSGCIDRNIRPADGTIARARHEVTDFGKVFDPIADSVSRQTVLSHLWFQE